ncbi:SLC13 family permease [Aliiglaciecola sp. CAU 1673]|uniref:SLC13 family permease n=1 Tax=Aliiglaciecola sp. CAU 1673 TaxID=3032595 RepID=UPI0023DA962E|nr:SLC13 family permease [Aliiglaciecola sp. CAU 1673]MDF2178079.1 SLC13 family permease [Aliiglaciecola sp. CAU 1673]
MDFGPILVSAIFFATILALVVSDKSPEAIFTLALLALLGSGQLSLKDATAGLTNQGLITLVLLLLVSVAVDKTSMIKSLARKLVTKSYAASYWRMFALTFTSSSVLNNTAIVASLLSPIKQNQLQPASKLLLPMNYAAIMGGTVTLVGTSTNLIVDSFLVKQGQPGFAFLDFTLYGLTAGLAGGVIMYVLSSWLPVIESKRPDYKEYFIEAKVHEDSPLVGKTVEENHLRNLPELFLVEIVRHKHLISPVTPDILIEAGDKLIFSGNIKRVDSLSHLPGLSLFAESNGLLRENLTEVMVSNRATLIDKTLKQIGFRALFDAAVVAIRRDGEQLSGKLGDIPLQAGDNLLLATGPDFAKRNNLSKNFFILSEHSISKKLTAKQEVLTLGGFLLAILLSATAFVDLAISLLFLLAALTFTGIVSGNELKRYLPINLIMVIVGSLALATALEQSGAIEILKQWLMPHLQGTSPFVALVVIYLITFTLTELVTNNAAAALMFPFMWALVQILDAPVLPFALAVAFGASASFISPWGYQTNLLVFTAGNYKLTHFVRFGIPLAIVYSTVLLAMLKWGFDL